MQLQIFFTGDSQLTHTGTTHLADDEIKVAEKSQIKYVFLRQSNTFPCVYYFHLGKQNMAHEITGNVLLCM